MAWQAVYFGLDAIEDGVQTMVDTTQPFYFRIWYTTKDPFISYNGGSYEQGMEYMLDNLRVLAESDYSPALCLKFYNDKANRGHLYKTECAGLMYICVLEKEKQVELKQQLGLVSGYRSALPSTIPAGYMTEKQWQEREELKNLPQTIGTIVAEQLALLRPAEPVAEPVAEVPDTIGSVLISHLKDPEVVNQVLDKFPVIMEGMQRLLAGILPGIIQQPQPAMAQTRARVSGVPAEPAAPLPADIAGKSDAGHGKNIPGNIADNCDKGSETVTGDIAEKSDTAEPSEQDIIEFNRKIDDALAILNNHCLLDKVLPALAKMAVDEPDKFKMALTFLTVD